VRRIAVPYVTTPDGVEMYYTEQGSGQPVLFSHGWPLSSDAWQTELKFFSDNGFRAIAHDRRGHGRSSKTAEGHTIDQYARIFRRSSTHWICATSSSLGTRPVAARSSGTSPGTEATGSRG
jgi:pimeloyl-ACP methyl ester carboxylesterase